MLVGTALVLKEGAIVVAEATLTTLGTVAWSLRDQLLSI